MNSHEVFILIHQGCFAGTGAIVRLPQCQRSKPDGYGKISQCITTTKHSKAKTVCIFLGLYCTLCTKPLCQHGVGMKGSRWRPSTTQTTGAGSSTLLPTVLIEVLVSLTLYHHDNTLGSMHQKAVYQFIKFFVIAWFPWVYTSTPNVVTRLSINITTPPLEPFTIMDSL